MATDAAGDRPRHDQRMGRPLRAGMVLSARGRERVVAEAEVAAGVCVLDEPAGPFADHDAYLRDAPVLPPSSGRSRFGAFWLTAWLLLAVGLWFGRSFVAGEPHVSSASATVAAARITQPIEQIEVGQRVVVDAPMAEQDYAFGDEVDSATWRRVTLRAPKRDGGWADVTLLRPAAWLAERGAAVGGTIDINVPECGIEGQAEVLAIGPCPAIAGGKGRIVTGTFRHSSANIIDLHVEGLSEPIGTTANHPFWSIDRQSFVRADSLQPGERLRGADGPHAVVRIVHRPAREPVYNLEIQVDHVYHVGSAGLLVHNAKPCSTRYFGTPGFGTEVHQRFHQALVEQTGTAPEDWIMRTKPGQKGVDAEYIGPPSTNPGFRYAELKPVSESGVRTFNDQLVNWGLPPGETQLWGYNDGGIIGSSGVNF